MKKTDNTFTKTLTGLVISLIAQSSFAAWDVRPVIKAEVEHSDNVRLIQNRDGGTVSTVTGQLAGRWVEDTNTLDFVLGGTYTDYTDVDRYDENSALFVRLNGRRNFERGAIGLVANGREDDYQRIYNQVGQGIGTDGDGLFLGDSGVGLPTGGEIDVNQDAVVEQIDRTRFNVRPYAEYRFSQQSVGRVYYQYTSVDFEDLGEQLGLRDSDRHGVGVDYEFSANARNTYGIEVSANEFSPDNRDDIDTREVRFGWSHLASENLRLNFYVGYREVDTTNREESGELFRMELDRQLRTGRFQARLERSVYPSSYGQIIEGDTISLGYRTQFTERFGFRLRMQATAIEPDAADNVQDDRDYASATPELIWSLSETSSLHFSYTYQYIDRRVDELLGLDPAQSHGLSVGFEYHPRRRF